MAENPQQKKQINSWVFSTFEEADAKRKDLLRIADKTLIRVRRGKDQYRTILYKELPRKVEEQP